MKKQTSLFKTVLLGASLMLASASYFPSVATPLTDDTPAEKKPPKIFSLQVMALSQLCAGTNTHMDEALRKNVHTLMESTFTNGGYHRNDPSGTYLCNTDIETLSYAFGLGQLTSVLSSIPDPLIRACLIKDASKLRHLTIKNKKDADDLIEKLNFFKNNSLALFSTMFKDPAIGPGIRTFFLTRLIRECPSESRLLFARMSEELFGLETPEADQCRTAALRIFDPNFPPAELALMRGPSEAIVKRFNKHLGSLFTIALNAFEHETARLNMRFSDLEPPEKKQAIINVCAQYLEVTPDVFKNMPDSQKSHLFTQRLYDLCVPLLTPVPTSERLNVLEKIMRHIPLEKRIEVLSELSTSRLLRKRTGKLATELFDHTLLTRLIMSTDETRSARILETNELIDVVGTSADSGTQNFVADYFGACQERRDVILHSASRIKEAFTTQGDRRRMLHLSLRGDETDLAAQDIRLNVLIRFADVFKTRASGLRKDFCFQILETLTTFTAEQQNALLNDLFAPCMDVLLASEQPTWSKNLIESLADSDTQERVAIAGLISEFMTGYMEHRNQLTGKKPKGTTLDALIESLKAIDPQTRRALVLEATPFFLSTDKCMTFGPFLTSLAALEPAKRSHFVNACIDLASAHTAPSLLKFNAAIQSAFRDARALTLREKRGRDAQTPDETPPLSSEDATSSSSSSSSSSSQTDNPQQKKPRAQ